MLRLFLDLNQDSQKKNNQNNDLGLSGFVMRRQNCSSSFFGVEYLFNEAWRYLKFIYSEKVTKFCEISTLLLAYVVPVKSKVEISQNFVAISEYMNFNKFSPTVLKCLIIAGPNSLFFKISYTTKAPSHLKVYMSNET